MRMHRCFWSVPTQSGTYNIYFRYNYNNIQHLIIYKNTPKTIARSFVRNLS